MLRSRAHASLVKVDGAGRGGRVSAPPHLWGRSNPFPTHEQIGRRAQELYYRRGCPPGPRTQFWFEAEQQLLSRAARFVLRACERRFSR